MVRLRAWFPRAGITPHHKWVHFWIITVLLVGHTLFHYAASVPKIGQSIEGLPFFDLHILHEAEYLIIIAYASMVFRTSGGLAALLATGLASVPFILGQHIPSSDYGGGPAGSAYEGYGIVGSSGGLQNRLLEFGVIMVIGAFIVFVNEMWGRERDRRQAALDQLKAAQQQLVQSQRLNALGQMASGIAHDFNNALMPIMGYSELLLKSPPQTEDPAEARRYLEAINTAAKDAAGIVSRLREFYRPRKASDTFSPVDLQAIVHQTLELTEPKWRVEAQLRGVAINVATDVPSISGLLGSQAELRQALTNLVLNAVDAMPNGGTLAIRARRQDGAVLLGITDTGMGMTEDVRRRCFEPFFSTKGPHGTGLGLSMVYGIVQRHGGTIDVQSILGKGTTFTIRLPLQSNSRDMLALEGRAPVSNVTSDKSLAQPPLGAEEAKKAHRGAWRSPQ